MSGIQRFSSRRQRLDKEFLAKRLEGAVSQTESLWRMEVEQGRSEAWKMADVLGELLDLLDAVRPNPRLGTQPSLRVEAP